MHKKTLSVLLTLVVFAGLMYWIWTLPIAWYIKIAITIGSIGVRFFIAALIGTKSSAVSDYTSNQSHSFSLPPWLLLPLAQVWGWSIKLGFVALLIFGASFFWNNTSIATAFGEENRMWKTGVVRPHDDFEEYKLIVTDEMDYMFVLPRCARTEAIIPHRVRRSFPTAHTEAGPTAVTNDVCYSVEEVYSGIGTNPSYKGNTSYMNTFYMAFDPSAKCTRDTVTIWVYDQNKVASR